MGSAGPVGDWNLKGPEEFVRQKKLPEPESGYAGATRRWSLVLEVRMDLRWSTWRVHDSLYAGALLDDA